VGQYQCYDQTTEYDGYNVQSLGFGVTVGKNFTDYIASSLKYGLDKSVIQLSQDLSTAPPPIDVIQQIVDYGNTIITSALYWTIARDSRDYFS